MTETGWIQTRSGRKFYPLDPRPEDVCLADIAHALSLQCRYGGHCSEFYSVAQHSVLVSRSVPPADALHGLLHDAAEAYLVDLPRPVKQRLRQLGVTVFDLAETTILHAVCHRFGLTWPVPESVQAADRLLLVTESRDLMAPLHPEWHYSEANGYPALPGRVLPWSPARARDEFLARFRELAPRGGPE